MTYRDVLPPHAGFAVVDVETTGFSPQTNRVVEIAVVNLDVDLCPQGEFVSLVNPGRDVGPTSVHGITATDVRAAPAFADLAPDVVRRVAGRVVVAHNAPFDVRFLLAELGRIGVLAPEPVAICTMQLAASYFPDAPSRRLVDCCGAAGIAHESVHSALADAAAVAALLRTYAGRHTSMPPSWAEALTEAAFLPWPVPPAAACRPLTREAVRRARAEEVPFLSRLVARLPRYGVAAQVEPYLAVLDSALEDRLVTEVEARQLAELAGDLGLTSEIALGAHRLYLAQLALAAVADGVVTAAERDDLRDVVRLLGLDDGEVDDVLGWAATEAARGDAAAPASGSRLHAGDSVVFTGECDLPRAELEARARAAGLVVKSGVSRKTTLLVIADPHSQSAKARAARDAGIRIVSEQVFLNLLGEVDPAPRAAPAAAMR